MGEAKRRRDRAPVTIMPKDGLLMGAAMDAARKLAGASVLVGGTLGDTRPSSTLSTAFQLVVLAREDLEPNDVVNGVCATLAWALHVLPQEQWSKILAAATDQILDLAADSLAAANLHAASMEGQG